MGGTQRRAAMVVWCAVVSATCQHAPDAPPEFIYVSNEDSGDVSVIDSGSDEEIARIPVGKRPRGLRVSRDGSTLYVAVSGSPKAGPGRDDDARPPVDHAADGIAVVDLARRRVVRTLAAGSDPESFDLSADETLAFVANEDSGQLTVVDTRDGHIAAVLEVGDEPEGVTTSPDGTTIYVASEGDNVVTVVDVRERRVLGRIPTGARPRTVIFAPDGKRAFVSNELSGDVTVIDTSRRAAVDTARVDGDEPRPMGLALSPDGKSLFVSTGRDRAVARIDTTSLTTTRVIRDVGARPWGIARAGHKLYTANGGSCDVTVLHGDSGVMLKKIRVGAFPWGIAVGPGPRVLAATLGPAPRNP